MLPTKHFQPTENDPHLSWSSASLFAGVWEWSSWTYAKWPTHFVLPHTHCYLTLIPVTPRQHVLKSVYLQLQADSLARSIHIAQKMSNTYEPLDGVELKPWDQDFEAPIPVDQSGRIPPIWRIACYVLASLSVLLGAGALIGCPIGLELTSTPTDAVAYAMCICVIIVSVAAGVCAPIAVVFATHETVIPWSIAHLLFLAFNIVFVIVNETSSRSPGLTTVLGIAMCASQSLFFGVYAPLISIKNLQRAPGCCRS